MIEALDDGLDGSFGHQRSVLADGGEIDEGQPGDFAVVIADYRYITGNVYPGPGEGVEDAVGAPVIGREDGGRQLIFVEDMAARRRTRFLGVVAISYVFPYMVTNLGSSGTFAIFAAINVCSLIFVIRFAPETRGRTLEELEDDFRSHDASRFEHEAPQGVYGS
jgi:Sugar (and other) transporter